MPAGTNPAADNTLEYQIAELQRQVANLANASGGFQTGDYLFSEVVHPDMIGSTLSDGGRPGWWLMNGATFVAADDPTLFQIRGSTTLPDYNDRVLGVPGSTHPAWEASGADSVSVAAHTHSTPAHAHGVGSISATVASNGSFQGGATGTVGSPGSASMGGSTASDGSSTTGSGGGSSVSVVQPTRFCGAAWIKR